MFKETALKACICESLFYNGIPQEAYLNECALAMFITGYDPHEIHEEKEIDAYMDACQALHAECELIFTGSEYNILVTKVHVEYYFPEEFYFMGERFEYRMLSQMQLRLPPGPAFLAVMEVINGRIPRNIVLATLLRMYIDECMLDFIQMPHACEHYLGMLTQSPEEEIFCNLILNNCINRYAMHVYFSYILRGGDWPRFAALMSSCANASEYEDILDDLNLDMHEMNESKWDALEILIREFPFRMASFFPKILEIHTQMHPMTRIPEIIFDILRIQENQ